MGVCEFTPSRRSSGWPTCAHMGHTTGRQGGLDFRGGPPCPPTLGESQRSLRSAGQPTNFPGIWGRGGLPSVMLGTAIRGRVVIPGDAEGIALVSDEPLSFWGGYDHRTGEIIDRRHPLAGQIAAGRILCLPFSRGSSTTTAVLLEATCWARRRRPSSPPASTPSSPWPPSLPMSPTAARYRLLRSNRPISAASTPAPTSR